MGIILRFPKRDHARAFTAAGRGTAAGQAPAGGQLSENQASARSSRFTLMSAPHSRALNFFPSFKARELTVERETPSILAYRLATMSSESIPDMSEISVTLPIVSTAFLPDARFYRSGHLTGMDLAIVYDNIQRLLVGKKVKGNAISKRAGSPDAIRNIKRKLDGKIKGDGITAKTLDAIARELGVTSDYLKTPFKKAEAREMSGVRQALLDKIAYLDQEKARALLELEAIDAAAITGKR